MNYLNYKEETAAQYSERLELVMERISGIADDPQLPEPYADYFQKTALYQLKQYQVWKSAWADDIDRMNAEAGAELNRQMYGECGSGAYESSYADPAFAIRMLGKEAGQLLSALLVKMCRNNPQIFRGLPANLCIYAELFVELYTYFSEPECLSMKDVKECVRWFMHDYSEIFQEYGVSMMLDPEFGPYAPIVMEADLTNTDYLYHYGYFVGEDEIRTAEKLAAMTEAEIQSMADTMTEGYRIGFQVMNKPLEKKEIVEVRYPLGFERMIRAVTENYQKMHLKCVFVPYSSSVNRQMDHDHKEDASLWLDKEFAEYQIECYRKALEEKKAAGKLYGGPDIVEVFGMEPFTPEAKAEVPHFDEKQQKVYVRLRNGMAQLTNQYLCGEERSFSVLAYPLPSIGPDYDEIFAETVRLNTLDYMIYRDIQQKIIDVLDTGDRVHVTGCGANHTDLYVNLWKLQDPEKETIFENCVADVNIPLGEVFTTPVLKGTEGRLHVTQVYLEEYDYRNLELIFEDGLVKEYSCTNFEDPAENKKYIEEHILFHNPTLPMGEFAIGTNTVAYRMGRKYNIQGKLPILIAEKTGPHFAVGDTCYPYDEDNMTYNPDGKAIVARENDYSALRKTDIEKAYFNCHTDITIPYDELGAITVIRKDGTTTDIIRNGRFVLPGTELLNEALNC